MKVDVLHIAKLANVFVKKEEENRYQNQLSSIVKYIDKLLKVDTENVKETSQTTNLENVTTEDIPSPSLSSEDALSNTKSKHNELFKVKAIFE